MVLLTANGSFDLVVLARYFAQLGVDAMPGIYRALEQNRVFDIQIAEALHAIAQGHLGRDPRSGGELKNPETGRRGRYSLSICVDQVLGRTDAKANDEWRLRYGELKNIPIETWPQEARDYPRDDARNTAEVALAQCGHFPKHGARHEWGNARRPDGSTYSACMHCGATKFSAVCTQRTPHRNLHDLGNQVYSAFALHLGAAAGFSVDQSWVDVIQNYVRREHAAHVQPFIAAGIYRDDGSENRSVLKRRVAEAYGASVPCPVCQGTGKIPKPNQKTLQCPDCRGRCVPWKGGGKIKDPTVANCATCVNTGRIPHPKPELMNCCAIPRLADGSENTEAEREMTCDGTGYVLDDGVPRTKSEGIGFGGDVLFESGDEFLMGLGSLKEDQKIDGVYIPYLRRARVPIGGHAEECPHHKREFKEHCTCLGPFSDIPLTLMPNVVLETGRVSYAGSIQQFPRAPGFMDRKVTPPKYIPSLRECLVARPGRVFSSEDFDSGELMTHAQSCIYLVGHSALAEALNAGVKVHNALGASMIGLGYDEFQKRIKERFCKDARQAAKPGNFGFPGGLGPCKLVLQQRKQGPDTPCPGGPALVDDGDGNLVPGYKGLRFCILMDGATSCGSVKATKWGRQQYRISPTCRHCIECAQRLREYWLRQWPENDAYFKLIESFIEDGMVVTPEALDRWPWLQPHFTPWQRLAPGEIMQHFDGRIRQLATATKESPFCSGANGFFQALLATIAKRAAQRVSRECYDRTVRIPTKQYENSRASKFAGGPSPLLGSTLIGFFHDELFAEHPEAVAPEAADRISEVMTEEMVHVCPDVAVNAKAEPTLMRRWNKQASCVRDTAGRLQVWEPK